MHKTLFRAMSALLISSISLQAFAANTPTGMIYVTGPVAINGKNVAAPTTVFNGDSVQTASAAGATIASKGMRITLASKTGVAFAEDGVNLSCGSAAFESSASTPVKVGRFSVSPSAKEAHFQVMNRGGLVQIAALEGGINIFDGSQTLPLAAGKMFTVPTSNACIDPQGTNAQGTDASQNSGTNQASSKKNKGDKGDQGVGSGKVGAIAIGTGVGIGVTAAVLAARSNKNNQASPIVP